MLKVTFSAAAMPKNENLDGEAVHCQSNIHLLKHRETGNLGSEAVRAKCDFFGDVLYREN